MYTLTQKETEYCRSTRSILYITLYSGNPQMRSFVISSARSRLERIAHIDRSSKLTAPEPAQRLAQDRDTDSCSNTISSFVSTLAGLLPRSFMRLIS